MLFFAVVAYVIFRIDVLPLTTDVLVDGVPIDVPRMYFTVDHPFHIARSHLIADAWRSLESVRWVASHQGGYPAEFFPFGVPGIVAALHFLTLSTLSIESAYMIAVVGLYLLPGVSYWLMTRADRVSPGAALLAFTGHVAIASTWLQGGYNELIEWGLVTNAAGSLFALLALPILTVAVQQARFRWGLLAGVCIALSVYSNPRSLIAVMVVAVALLIHAMLFSPPPRSALVRLAAVGALSIAVCAPVVFPLLRYSDLYFFLHYQAYESVGAFVEASVDTVTLPIAVLTLAGCVLPFLNTTHRVSQVVAIAFVVYASLTALATGLPLIQELIPQLELPRLMPFQRLLMLYLAGYATVDIAKRAAGRLDRFGIPQLAAAITVAGMFVVFTTGVGPRTLEEQALRPIPRVEGAAAIELASMRRAVEHADAVAPADTAILVLGGSLSWHEQLWAPIWSDRRFYYDDWLWYWHRLHEGPYDYRAGHYYPNPTDTLDSAYLGTHGIGAVVVTNAPDDAGGGNARVVASEAEQLRREGTFGRWDVYAVTDATPLATLNGASPEQREISEDRERITLSFADAEAGRILVRQNWFPRWSATIDGEPVDVERAANGYIEIPTNGGDIDVELTYGITAKDWVARVLTVVASVVIVVGLIAGATPIRRLARR